MERAFCVLSHSLRHAYWYVLVLWVLYSTLGYAYVSTDIRKKRKKREIWMRRERGEGIRQENDISKNPFPFSYARLMSWYCPKRGNSHPEEYYPWRALNIPTASRNIPLELLMMENEQKASSNYFWCYIRFVHSEIMCRHAIKCQINCKLEHELKM